MSKNPSIKEGGQAKQFTGADKIQTKLVGGGTQNWVPENEAGKYADVGTLYANKNGTYYSKSDKKDGYNKVVVKVAGSNGSAKQDGKPSGDIAPGGAGSAVVGTNPETGNEEVVGVDEGGNLVKTPIPSGIWVRTPPTKTECVVGETIDYTGIVVSPIKKDQSTFVDERYPAGKIPFEELIFPVEVAPKVGPSGYTSDLDLTPYTPPLVSNDFIRVGSRSTTPGVDYDYDLTCSGGVRAVCWWDQSGQTGWVGFIVASEQPARYQTREFRYGAIHSSSEAQTEQNYTYDGKTVYYAYARLWQYCYVGGGFQSGVPLNGYGYPVHPEQVAWTIVYGTPTGGSADIPVQWVSPYDGRELEDSFEITVTGSSHTTESSSGTEGSGGGGTF